MPERTKIQSYLPHSAKIPHMGRTKHDWSALKLEFMESVVSVRQFLRTKGIGDNNRNAWDKVNGWDSERTAMQQHAEDEAMSELMRERKKTIIRLNQDFYKIGMALGGTLVQFIASRKGKGLSPAEVKTVWHMVRVQMGLPTTIKVEQEEKEDDVLTEREYEQMTEDIERGAKHRA